jgi:hypothetical protein
MAIIERIEVSIAVKKITKHTRKIRALRSIATYEVWLPVKNSVSIIKSFFGVSFTNESKKLCFVTHQLKKFIHGGRVTEIVDLPADLRRYVESIMKPPFSQCKILNELLISSCCFIALNPSSIDELKPAFLDQLLDSLLCEYVLIHPPPLEEPNLSMSERFPRI